MVIRLTKYCGCWSLKVGTITAGLDHLAIYLVIFSESVSLVVHVADIVSDDMRSFSAVCVAVAFVFAVLAVFAGMIIVGAVFYYPSLFKPWVIASLICYPLFLICGLYVEWILFNDSSNPNLYKVNLVIIVVWFGLWAYDFLAVYSYKKELESSPDLEERQREVRESLGRCFDRCRCRAQTSELAAGP